MPVITPSPSALEWRESLGEGVVMKVEIKMRKSMGVRYPHGEGNQSRLLKKIVPFDKNYHACKNPLTDARNHPLSLCAGMARQLGRGGRDESRN